MKEITNKTYIDAKWMKTKKLTMHGANTYQAAESSTQETQEKESYETIIDHYTAQQTDSRPSNSINRNKNRVLKDGTKERPINLTSTNQPLAPDDTFINGKRRAFKHRVIPRPATARTQLKEPFNYLPRN